MSVCDVVFFCKQKTAYEMRISDWSSDVCSSDLDRAERGGVRPRRINRERPEAAARGHELADQRLHAAARHQRAHGRLHHADRDATEIDLRPSPRHRAGGQLLDRDAEAALDRVAVVVQMGSAQWWDMVVQYVSFSVVAGESKKKENF